MEGLRFESDSMPRLNGRSLFTQQQVGTRWEHWGDKGGEEGNWPPYLTCRWLRISVLSIRHSPTYESIRDYLYRTRVSDSKEEAYTTVYSVKDARKDVQNYHGLRLHAKVCVRTERFVLEYIEGWTTIKKGTTKV